MDALNLLGFGEHDDDGGGGVDLEAAVWIWWTGGGGGVDLEVALDLVDWRWWRSGFGGGGSGVDLVVVLVGGGGKEFVAPVVVWVRWSCGVREMMVEK
ncbi:hypothetical protein LWI29_003335 [Acer saccharum]|uniref:Uncharacterized protein n=1 Tax=Acer saccharum TaxID=4024 RepID=A0AA39S2I1_ACESA|nr:hypothetical protein LWI29_003335 [Acer saccharum]